MSQKSHNSLRYKMQIQPNKTYKDLKQKQKARISEWMFREVCNFYMDHGRIPESSELTPLAEKVYTKIQGAAIWVPYESFFVVFEKKLPRYEERISANGIPAPKPPKEKKSEKEKQAIKRANRRKRKRSAQTDDMAMDQDDRFFYIAGYTSGGVPYGVTWEEMGLEPWQDPEDIEI